MRKIDAIVNSLFHCLFIPRCHLYVNPAIRYRPITSRLEVKPLARVASTGGSEAQSVAIAQVSTDIERNHTIIIEHHCNSESKTSTTGDAPDLIVAEPPAAESSVSTFHIHLSYPRWANVF